MAVPVTGYTELDIIGFTDKGTYNAATTYVANDLVSYNGIKWKCLQDGTVGVTPAEGVSWSVFIVDNEIKDNETSLTSTWSSQKINNTKADQTAIGPVENGTTASRAYAIGEHFMKDGAFCTAIAAIAQGATFTLDTNYTAGTVGARVAEIESELQEISEDTYTPLYSYSGGKLSLKKWGRIVTFQGCALDNTLPVGEYATIYSALPAKYRPKSTVNHSSVDNVTGTPFVVSITTAGAVEVYVGASQRQIVRLTGASFAYISAN